MGKKPDYILPIVTTLLLSLTTFIGGGIWIRQENILQKVTNLEINQVQIFTLLKEKPMVSGINPAEKIPPEISNVSKQSKLVNYQLKKGGYLHFFCGKKDFLLTSILFNDYYVLCPITKDVGRVKQGIVSYGG